MDSSPALASDGTIYFGSWDKNFYAVSPDGTKQWKFPTGGPVVSSPAISGNGTIYFGSHDNKFYALGPDGHKKWEYAVGGPIISSPAINQQEGIYFTSVDGFCYALDFDGGLKWRLRTGGVTESSPVIAPNGTVYLAVNKHVWGITPAGEKKWEATVDDFIVPTPLILADSTICFESGWGVMFNMGLEEGFNWKFVPVGRNSPAVAPSGEIYVSDATRFTAIRSKVPLARSPWPKFRGNARNTGNVNDMLE